MRQQNIAFMMKIAYHLTVDNQKLWTRVLKGKYGWDGVLPLTLRKTNVSRLWRGVCEIWEDFKDCISWHVRNGESTDFWYDNWVDSEGRLVNFYNRLDSPRPISVAGMIDVVGMWDWNRFSHVLPEQILQKIYAIRPPMCSLGPDVPSWLRESNRQFSTTSAYDFLSDSVGSHSNFQWRYIWELKLPQWIKIFVWIAAHNRLLTNAERYLRHISMSDRCPFCHNNCETVDHVLRHCLIATTVWLAEIKAIHFGLFMSLPFDKWIEVNINGACHFATNKENWSERFAVFLWMLWKNRCSKIFNESYVQRVDFRNHCNSLANDKEVIEILNGSSVALDGSSLVSAIVELLLRNWIVRCCHVFRESNMVADKLASVRCSYSLVATEWSTPPPPLVDLVHKEMSNC
ncbi:hypothetical protein V6N11_010739 [Hibiscus sabdariffa]|uniref:Reverse transcriptase zinc-binding domain-containing protein n=1 Tax=Hibiscus sabdariffa TaxID=183260 RepID=A0ABR2S705_9ROSI